MKIREEVLEEADIIRFSGGEIPEVALWNGIHYLTQDEEGPRLKLTPHEERFLKRAVIERYLTIIERDLTLANIDQSLYRGVKRAAINWQRLKAFMVKEGFSLEAARWFVHEKLRVFLMDLAQEGRPIDVTKEELQSFISALGFACLPLLGRCQICYPEEA